MTAGVTEFAGLAPAPGVVAASGMSAGLGLGGDTVGSPILALSPAAYFQFNRGIIVTGSGVSQWADQSGNSRHLLQATDAARPSLQGDGSILFDGVDDFLKCSAFTLNQPETVYALFKPVSYTVNDRVFDGNTTNTGVLYQDGTTPSYGIFAGSGPVSRAGPVVGVYGAVAAVFNGVSSALQFSGGTQIGAAGAGNMGGFALGSRGDTTIQFSNIQVKEVAIFAAAHAAATRAAVIAYLSAL